MLNWRRWLGLLKVPVRVADKRRFCRPLVYPLEDRTLPSVGFAPAVTYPTGLLPSKSIIPWVLFHWAERV